MIVVDKNHIPERARQIPVFCDDLPNLREGLVSKNREGARRRETDQCIELGLSGGEGEGAAVDVVVDVEGVKGMWRFELSRIICVEESRYVFKESLSAIGGEKRWEGSSAG